MLKKKIFRKLFFRKIYRIAPVLFKNPHQHGKIIRVRITTPRKPNSAKRKTLKAKLPNSRRNTVSFIPGIGHNLKMYFHVLVRGRGARDLPGVNTTAIRGALDLQGVLIKTKRRSIYGVKRQILC